MNHAKSRLRRLAVEMADPVGGAHVPRHAAEHPRAVEDRDAERAPCGGELPDRGGGDGMKRPDPGARRDLDEQQLLIRACEADEPDADDRDRQAEPAEDASVELVGEPRDEGLDEAVAQAAQAEQERALLGGELEMSFQDGEQRGGGERKEVHHRVRRDGDPQSSVAMRQQGRVGDRGV